VGDVWALSLSPCAVKDQEELENAARLEVRIKHWIGHILPTIPLLPSEAPPEERHLRQYTMIHTRFNHLRLLLRRRTMLSLTYDGPTGRVCGDFALDTVHRIKDHAQDAKSSSSFRYHMTAALRGAILMLATLLVRDLGSLGLHDRASAYAEGFRDAVGLLHDLAIYLQAARRVAEEFKDITQVVTTILNGGPPEMMPTNVADLFTRGFLDFAQPGSSELNGAVSWNGTGGTNADSWDIELQPATQGQGVSFI
jgi:hypothetical protein